MSFLVITVVCDYIIFESDLSFHIGMLVSNYKAIVVTDMCYSIVFGIVINCFMQIRLNIKNDLYWNANKRRNLLLAFFIILNLSYFTYIMVIIYFQKPQFSKVFINTYNRFIMFLFLIIASAVYFFIFKLIYRNQKAHKSSAKNIARIHQSEHHSFSNINFLDYYHIHYVSNTARRATGSLCVVPKTV